MAVVALIVAACGGAAETTTTAPPTTEASVETTAAETTTTAGSGGGPAGDDIYDYGRAPATTGTTETTAPTETEAPAAAGLGVAESSDGEHLVDADGNSLYLFVPDEQGASTCYDSCAATWPPLEGPLEAGAGVDPDMVGTVTRDDGVEQVTYNGWPLYLYAADSAPGDTNGQGVGGVWYLVDSAGDAIGG